MLQRLQNLCLLDRRGSRSTSELQKRENDDQNDETNNSGTSTEQQSQPKPPPSDSAQDDPSSIQPFRFYNLPPELQTYILELYTSTLYPRIIHRCLCSVCDRSPPQSHTPLASQLYKPKRYEHAASTKLMHRFTYCETWPRTRPTRSTNQASGAELDFPVDTRLEVIEPAAFLASKQLRGDVIDVLVRTRPMYACRVWRPWYVFRCCEMKVLPEWYRMRVRTVFEMHPVMWWVLEWPRKWSWGFTGLEELRMNYGRVKMSFGVEEEGRLKWTEGMGRGRIEKMVRRRVGMKMRKALGLVQHDDRFMVQRRYRWGDEMMPREIWIEKRKWKVVMMTEFRVKVRENMTSKRSWASIFVTAREKEDRTYSVDFKYDDRLKMLENKSPPCWYFVASPNATDS